jgi:hypothetical protein
VTKLSTEIATVKSVCDKVETDIKNFGAEPAVVMIFNGILDAIRGVSNVQAKLVANTQEKSSPPVSVSDDSNEFVVVGANSKRARPNRTGSTSSLAPPNHPVSTGNRPAPRVTPEVIVTNSAPISDEQRKLDKFKEAIFDAERSTLVFNLDMGRIPVMNKDTMSKRATLALSTMAAKLDKKTNSVLTAESIEAIDDKLSMVKNMELYGKETRTYSHPSDSMSGAFCTVPVRYEFEDPGIKFKAEKVLRKVCGAQCTTPYPLMVRECVKQIVSVVKNRYPDNYVRVAVDTQRMVFKASRKPPKDAVNSKWQYRDEDIPIPPICLDLSLRRVPKDFKLDIPVTPQKKRASVSSAGTGAGTSDMEVAQPDPDPATEQNAF